MARRDGNTEMRTSGQHSDGSERTGVWAPDSGDETMPEAAPVRAVRHSRDLEAGGTEVAPPAAQSDRAAGQERIAELELRLRERVEENSLLDEEVRCLLAERKIRDEYIASMEVDVLRLPLAERQLLDTDNAYKSLDAQFSSYRADAEDRIADLSRQIDAHRNRLSARAADRLAARLRQVPLAPDIARSLRRTLARLRGRG